MIEAEFLDDQLMEERPETSKFSRVSRRHNRTKTQMRSTSNGWGRESSDEIPLVKRRLTLDKRKPQKVVKSTPINDGKRQFRPGLTLKDYVDQQQENFVPGGIESEEPDEILFPQEFNYRIEEQNQEQQEDQRPKQSSKQSRKNLQISSQVTEERNFTIRNVWKNKQIPQLPEWSVQDKRRNTAMNFYNHKQTHTNMEEFEAAEEYLLKKYANKFHLNDQFGTKRIEKTISRNNKPTMLMTKAKLT